MGAFYTGSNILYAHHTIYILIILVNVLFQELNGTFILIIRSYSESQCYDFVINFKKKHEPWHRYVVT